MIYSYYMTRAKKNIEEQTHQLIDNAIDESVQPAPAPAGQIADALNVHRTLVIRRMARKGWVRTNGRWVLDEREDEE